METKRIISIAIAFAMLAVSFAVVSNARAQVTTVTNNSTELTLNAKYPKVYWMGFNLSDGPTYTSRMGVQVPVNNEYIFSLEYNYSFGSALCAFRVEAWYDGGAVAVPFPSTPTPATRNLAFRIDCTNAGVVTVTHPTGAPGEVTTSGTANIVPGSFDPLYPGQNHTKVYIPVTFGAQLRAATTNGYGSYSFIPGVGHQTTGTWNFNVTVRDTASSASNISYGEFGIQKLVTAAVSGSPTGNAPPGGNTGWIPIQSAITYSSNADYTVRVEIDNLVDTVTPIGANFVMVKNLHLNASGNSEISNALGTSFTGPGAPLYVWGAAGSPIAASNHGTTSIGPLDSNFYGAETTNLQWRVAVPAGTAEGIYTSEIRVTVDNT